MIPVEVKPSRQAAQPQPADVLQLLAYCLLVEETWGRPAYGLLHYASGTFRVDYTDSARALLLAEIEAVRAARQARDMPRSHDQPGRCAACAFRAECERVAGLRGRGQEAREPRSITRWRRRYICGGFRHGRPRCYNRRAINRLSAQGVIPTMSAPAKNEAAAKVTVEVSEEQLTHLTELSAIAKALASPPRLALAGALAARFPLPVAVAALRSEFKRLGTTLDRELVQLAEAGLIEVVEWQSAQAEATPQPALVAFSSTYLRHIPQLITTLHQIERQVRPATPRPVLSERDRILTRFMPGPQVLAWPELFVQQRHPERGNRQAVRARTPTTPNGKWTRS